jgi:hypothetical protein
MLRMAQAEHHATGFVHRIAAILDADERVEYLWLEGEDDSVQWPPYERVDLHVGVPEPGLDSLRREFGEVLGRADAISDYSQQDAPLQGFAGTATLSDGTPITYRLERTSQICKVPRKAINVLLDGTGMLLASLDTE